VPACLVAVFVAVTVVMVLLHHSANSTSTGAAPPPAVTSSGSTTGAAPPAAVASSGSTRLVAATQVADEATSTTILGLHALKGIPTIVTVAALINPYVSSLQQYANALPGTDVPATAQTAAANALALVGEDVQFLSTINGLQPVRLGSYLEQFGHNAAQFQKALATLEHDLGAPTT